jgi:hypothetical protein
LGMLKKATGSLVDSITASMTRNKEC